MFKTIFWCARKQLKVSYAFYGGTMLQLASFPPARWSLTPFLNHRGQGNPANERIRRHIIKLENLREELPPLLKKYNLDKAGHPETSFWALAFCRKSTCSIDVKILMFPKALPEGIEWIGRQGIATGNKCQRIKHF